MVLYTVANVLSLRDASDEFHFVRYFDKFDRFTVQVNKKGPIYTFHTDTNFNTYIYDLDNDITDSNSVAGQHIVTLVSTVSDTSIKVRIPIMTAAKNYFMITEQKKIELKKKV